MTGRSTAIALSVLLAMSAPVFADDIADAISDAQKAYKSGDLSTAKQALDLASQLIAQKNAEGLVKAFPAPLSGWTSEQADITSGGLAAMSGSGASQRYTNAKDDTISISIVADGPVLTQMVTVLANPQVAGMMGKIIRIGDQRGVQDRDGDITILVANRFIVKVEGSAKVDDKLAYAKAINYKVLLNFK